MYLYEIVTENISDSYALSFTPKGQKKKFGWPPSCPWFRKCSRKIVSIRRLIIPKFCLPYSKN
jgi:hypothetical protein